MLEFAGVASVHWNSSAVHMQLSHNGHTAIAGIQLRPEGNRAASAHRGHDVAVVTIGAAGFI